MKTLEIHNLTREDAAVVECQSINYFQKQAQLVILGEHVLCLRRSHPWSLLLTWINFNPTMEN